MVLKPVSRMGPPPIIFDAKIGETDNSMKAYLKYFIEDLKVDAAVVNPFMGEEVLAPFAPGSACGAVVLVRTSNPGSVIFQDQQLSSGEKLWERVLRVVLEKRAAGFDLIPVLASTADIAKSSILHELPIDVPVFVAGYGAQGGSLELVRSLVRLGHRSIVVNSSRDILFAHEKTSSIPWQIAISDAARAPRRSISEH